MKLLAISTFATLAVAQRVLEQLSFGHKDKISQDGQHLLGWRMLGDHEWNPELLSDRIVLTPPWPHYRSSALWTEQPMLNDQWTADVEFRVTGPDHGEGTLNIWYTKENQNHIRAKSVYTVEKFEGLAVLVDRVGTKGEIRAFLNDGTVNYASHPHVEALPFGHCSYEYRNLGRPSKLSLQQDSSGFQITIDGQPCFRSTSVLLPNHYFFGITADTQETPDSVEIFKFIAQDTPTAAQIPAHHGQQQQTHHEEDEHWEYESDGMPQIHDTIASSIRDQQAQFGDLHDRLQVITHAIDNLFKDLTRHGSRVTTRMEDLNAQLAKIQHVTQLESRIGELENKIQQMRSEQKDWTGHFQQIENSLKTRHDALLAGLPESMGDVLVSKGPNMKLFLFLLVGFQLVLGAGYVIYRKRLASAPKKYL